MTHTLRVRCAAGCDAAPDGCDCSIYFAHLSMTCTAERDAGGAPIPCGNLEPCGCRVPAIVGPRAAGPAGSSTGMIALTLPNGGIVWESLDAADWVTYFAPTCPSTGLPHGWWGDTVSVSGAECFAKLCAENNDAEQFADLDISRPGDYDLDYVVIGGEYPQWSLAVRGVGHRTETAVLPSR